MWERRMGLACVNDKGPITFLAEMCGMPFENGEL